MNELMDKLIIRILLTIFICFTLFAYKYAHTLLYPSSRSQLLKRFFPTKNTADTIHLFGKIFGLGLIFSEFNFFMSDGVFLALFDFLIISFLAFTLYLLSVYIIESIVLYNFEYHDEIIKRKNIPYAIISFAHAIGLSYILKTGVNVAKDGVHHIPIYLIFLWLFAMVILGFSIKTYSLVSKLPFNRLLIQKNYTIAFSYSGFFLGWSIIIASSLDHDLINIKDYAIQTFLKILLSLIIFPIFKKGLAIIFRLQEAEEQRLAELPSAATDPLTGYGVYEGVLLVTSALLTSVITNQIFFGTFYPRF